MCLGGTVETDFFCTVYRAAWGSRRDGQCLNRPGQCWGPETAQQQQQACKHRILGNGDHQCQTIWVLSHQSTSRWVEGLLDLWLCVSIFWAYVYTNFKKFGVSSFSFFLKKLMFLFSNDALNCSKMTLKTFILQILFFLLIKKSWKNTSWFPQKY